MKNAPWIVLALAGVLFAGMALFAVVAAAGFAGLGGGSSSGSTVPGTYSCDVGTADQVTAEVQKELGGNVGDPKQPPKVLIPLYQAAAAKYHLGPLGPSVLAAINRIETAFGTNRNVSSAGAQGWMQFMPSTWSAYGVDADGNGKTDIQDPDDAVFGAANYLHASGAPGSWQNGIFAYNHAQWYVDDVMSHARQYNIPEGTTVSCQGSKKP